MTAKDHSQFGKHETQWYSTDPLADTGAQTKLRFALGLKQLRHIRCYPDLKSFRSHCYASHLIIFFFNILVDGKGGKISRRSRERNRSEPHETRDGRVDQHSVGGSLGAMVDSSGGMVVYGTAGAREGKRGSVFSQLMDKVIQPQLML